MRKAGGILREAWHLASPYYRVSDERWSARLVLAAIIALGLLNVGVSVDPELLERLVLRRPAELRPQRLHQPAALVPLGRRTASCPASSRSSPSPCRSRSCAATSSSSCSIRWRRWMTNELLANWLSNRAYYTISLTRTPGDAGTDNPDQRVAEDIRDFTQNTLTLGVQLHQPGHQPVQLRDHPVDAVGRDHDSSASAIPGYMLFGAIIYAIVGTWLTHLVGPPADPAQLPASRRRRPISASRWCASARTPRASRSPAASRRRARS